ncbi:MAG: HU family DNA-binding protein [Bacteroidales bacterium]
MERKVTTRYKLARCIAEKKGCTAQEANILIDIFIDSLKEVVYKEGEVHISKFGKFFLKKKVVRKNNGMFWSKKNKESKEVEYIDFKPLCKKKKEED